MRTQESDLGFAAEVRRSKPEMALVEINRMMAAGVRFSCAMAETGNGLSAPFRQGLTARGLAWPLCIPCHLAVGARKHRLAEK